MFIHPEILVELAELHQRQMRAAARRRSRARQARHSTVDRGSAR